MKRKMHDGWFEKFLKFDWEGIDWDSESTVSMSKLAKEQKWKVLIG